MSELLQSYSDFLKLCFKEHWGFDIDSWDESTRKQFVDSDSKYRNPEYPENISDSEKKKYIVGNYLWYLYPHFYKVKEAFRKISFEHNKQGIWTSLTSPGNKYLVDIGAGLLTGTFAYCDFLKEFTSRSYLNDNNYNIYVIANEPDSYKAGLLNTYQDKIINLIQEKTGVSVNIEYINEPFPNSKDMIMLSLEKKKFFKELIIINACIIKWISGFIPDMYADLSAFSDRTHLVNIEPFYSDNKHGIEDKLKELSEFNSNQIDKLHNVPPQSIQYRHPNHPNGPFAHISSHADSFLMSYYYSTNLQKNFFTSERLKEAYYKTRQNIINSHFHDRIDLIMFDSAINLELERLSVKLAADYKFALTLDYKVHKNRKEGGGYNFRHMSTRKIDNEIVSAAIINPIAETDRYIEDTYGKKCSHGNRLAIQSKTRIYEYFLDNWLQFKRIAIEFAKEKDHSIFQYDIEKYYENIKIAGLTENLSAKYMRPQNNHVRKMTESLLTLKCYTTTKKTGCTECSYEDGSYRDCTEVNGLPQGPISSGFYANIYLYPLDEEMITMTGHGDDFLYLRYVDDNYYCNLSKQNR